MLAKHLSRSANEVIRRYDVPSEARGIADKNSTQARRPDLTVVLAEAKSLPTVIVAVAEADCQKTTFWSSVIGYLIESFALCGASLHPTALFPVEPDPDEEKIPQPRDIPLRERRGLICRISPTASQDTASPEFERKANHVMPAGYVVAFADERLRERERKIKKAAAALAELDDRTLLDMGIPHRSQIEQVVRFCHDC